MEVVIKIPKETYDEIVEESKLSPRNLDYFERKVAEGTPLPKGHGRLIDADVLVDGMEDDYEFCETVNATPTVIESEKGAEK